MPACPSCGVHEVYVLLDIVDISLRSKLIILALLIEGAVGVTAMIAAKVYAISLFPLSAHLVRDLVAGTVGALPPLAFFVFSLSRPAATIPLLRSIRKTALQDIRGVFSTSRLIDLCFISLMAGFAEELLFRGVIQVKGGIIVASIVFGLLHWVSPAYVLVATAIGFYIGVSYQLSQSLLIPIQVHCAYDFGALIYLRYFAHEKGDIRNNSADLAV